MVEHSGNHSRTVGWRLVTLGVLALVALFGAGWLPLARPVIAVDGIGSSDDFDRVVQSGWGVPSVGGSYAVTTRWASATVDGGAGQVVISSPGGRAKVVPTSVWLRDVDAEFRVQTNKSATGSGQLAVVIARRVSNGNEYQARIRLAPNGGVYLSVYRRVDGVRRQIGVEVRVKGLTHQAKSYLSVRVQVTGTDPSKIRVKAWASAQAEPSVWSLVESDRTARLTRAGSFELRTVLAKNSTNAPTKFTIDDLVIAQASSATNPATAASDTFAADAFDRSVSSGWGEADMGGSYSLSATRNDYSVAGGSGQIRVSRAGTTRSALLGAVSARDVELRTSFSLNKRPSSGSAWMYAIARASAGTEYRAKVRVRHDGAVFVSASRVVSGREVRIGSEVRLPSTYQAGTKWILQGHLAGASPTVLAVSAWPAAQVSPADWQYSATDGTTSLQSSGSAGLRVYVSSTATNAPFTFSVDDYFATLPTGSPETPTTPDEPTPSPVATPTPAPATPQPTPVATPTSAATPTPTAIPTASLEVTPFPTASATPAPTATLAPTPAPTAVPTPSPTAPPANAFYVSTSGSDSNAGSFSAPWRTLQKAADSVSAGATVLIRGGTYAGFTLRRSGTASAPITFTAYGSESPVIDGQDVVAYTVRLYLVQHVILSGLTVQGGFAERQHGGGIMIDNSAHVILRDNLLRHNKAFGVRSQNSTYVTIDGNEMTKNAVGVHIGNMGQGTFVTNNLIHHNDRMMTNTSDVRGDDVGAEGVALVKTTGTVVVSGNRIWSNRAKSYDYGYDGGAFSIYAASNWHIRDNITWDNRNVLETGTDSNRTPCNGNSFTRNVNYGATTEDRTVGMVLRCASNTLVANNTFHGTQYFVFDISHNRGNWGGSTEGLQIVNNIIWVTTGKVYGIETDPLPSSVVIDHNLVYNSGPGYLATVVGRGGTTSLATFRSWTGHETHGIQVDPRFVDAANHDYRLRADSPAVDSGRYIAGVTDGATGGGPDRGALERE